MIQPLGLESLRYIQNNKDLIKNRISENLMLIKESLGITSNSLIIPIEIGDNKRVITIQNELKKDGFLVGAIRQPTVKSAIIRLIAKIDISPSQLKIVCNRLKELK